jgi:DNA mismatch repair protein MutS2
MQGIDIREIANDENYKLPRPLKVGDKVFLTTISKEGIVTALADKKGQISVTSGILKTKVSEDKLRLLDGTVKYVADTPKVGEGKVKKTIVSTFSPEVDVRGI